jgi:hypothetical protein
MNQIRRAHENGRGHESGRILKGVRFSPQREAPEGVLGDVEAEGEEIVDDRGAPAAVSFGWLGQRWEGSFRAPDPRVSSAYDERGRGGPEEVHTDDEGTLVRKIENGGSDGMRFGYGRRMMLLGPATESRPGTGEGSVSDKSEEEEIREAEALHRRRKSSGGHAIRRPELSSGGACAREERCRRGEKGEAGALRRLLKERRRERERRPKGNGHQLPWRAPAALKEIKWERGVTEG